MSLVVLDIMMLSFGSYGISKANKKYNALVLSKFSLLHNALFWSQTSSFSVDSEC